MSDEKAEPMMTGRRKEMDYMMVLRLKELLSSKQFEASAAQFAGDRLDFEGLGVTTNTLKNE